MSCPVLFDRRLIRVKSDKRTQGEVARQYDVNVRTVRRWAAAGVNIQSDTAINAYLDARLHPGRAVDTPNLPATAPPPETPLKSTELARAYSFRTTDELINNLSDMASRSANELEADRITGASGPARARSAKVFNDAIHQLRLALVSRDELQSSTGASYSAAEVAFVFAQIFAGIRNLLSDEFPRMVVSDAYNQGLIEPENRTALEEMICKVVTGSVFSAFSEAGAHMGSLMLESRHLSTLRERQRLFYEVVGAWRGRDDLGNIE